MTACTEIYGGPDTATIEGGLDGRTVRVHLDRSNGCEIDRFDAWTPVFERLFPSYRPGVALGA